MSRYAWPQLDVQACINSGTDLAQLDVFERDTQGENTH